MRTPSKVHPLPPRGHYLAGEAGRLAGVSGQTIGQWARNGYIRSSQSDEMPRVYSFQDVAEAMVVHELRDRGMPYPDIKRTIAELRDRFGSDWPLTRARLATTAGEGEVGAEGRRGKGRIVASEDESLYDVGRLGWQQLHVEEDQIRWIAVLLQRGGWAARGLPDLRFIEVNPDRLSGRPTIRGRRVPAEKVARLAETDAGLETLRDEYDLDDDQISDARRWWGVAKKYDEAA
jgi:uncharacterized protein (DUF433 family)